MIYKRIDQKVSHWIYDLSIKAYTTVKKIDISVIFVSR